MNLAIGIDAGIKNHVVTCDGEYYKNISTERIEKYIEDLQKKLSRQVKDSKNYHKTLTKTERAYPKIRNR